MSNINFLVNHYDKRRIPYEDRGKEYDKVRKKEERKKELYECCNDLFYECKILGLSNYQKQRVKYLINIFGDDLKRLHGRAKKETIILAFIFYIKKIEEPKIRLDDYQVTGKYGLSNHIFGIIICRICEYFMRNMPIVPYATSNYDHETLSRNGGRL